MTFAGLAHSDQRRCTFVSKPDAYEVEVPVAPIGLASEHPFEPLLAKGLERALAVFVPKPFFRCATEPVGGRATVIGLDRDEKRVNGVFRTGLRPRLAPEHEGGQQPDRSRRPQVPEQEGANSSSSAAEMNSSLHQNDASEWPLRTH